MAAFTLTASDGLPRKWLFDHTMGRPTRRRDANPSSPADDGDLIKAGREAAAIRARHPDAKFVIWLCTNRRLGKDLQQLAYDKAAQLEIEVRFLEQSGLRDFLDVKPEGQWLRKEHLGIEADQVSASLLRKLAEESLSRYAHDLLLPSMDRIVSTRAARVAAEALRGLATLHLLVGPSGAGKSVIAHDLLRRHVDGGGVGLWIPGEIADGETSLPDAVDAVFRSLHPRTGVGAGYEALKLGTADQPLLLIVDDVNRSHDPVRLLRKVIGWSRPAGPNDQANAVMKNPVQVIGPAWDAYWYLLRHTHESLGWIRIQRIGAMTRPEAVACLKAALSGQVGGYTDAELGTFAKRLHASRSTYADEVVHLARAWLRDPGDFPVSMRYDAWWILAGASSPRVLDVTEGIAGNRWVWEARLRNGDAVAGALALSTDCFPAVRYAWLESLIEEARTHHGAGLTEQLRTFLRSRSLSDEHRYGALCLAGYLGDPGLAADAFASQKAMASQPRCDKEADELLRELLDRRVLGVEDSPDAIFNWWPGYPPDYKYSPDSILAFDPGVQGWVPLWFPRRHWSEADAAGQLRSLSEEERARWFHLWLKSELDVDPEWRGGTSYRRAIRVGWALREMAERVYEGWPEDWWYPDI